MLDRLSERPKKVLELANDAARNSKKGAIEAEHMFWGLIAEGSGMAAMALRELGVDVAGLREEAERRVKVGVEAIGEVKLPQSEEFKKVIAYAIEEARALGHNYIGTDHLLLGLLREREALAAKGMVQVEMKVEMVRNQIREMWPSVAKQAREKAAMAEDAVGEVRKGIEGTAQRARKTAGEWLKSFGF